jgi:ABC-type transporter Mla maintaining outer membrane lipid asymmetry ATPase subunit MlaF
MRSGSAFAPPRTMASAGSPLIRVRNVTKDYRALRPLRLKELEIGESQSVALLGFDGAMAEVLVSLITGAALPDTGEVLVEGSPTSSVTDSDTWMKLLERFGLLTDRTVLVEQLTTEQNLAIPHTLDLESASDVVRHRIRALAAEVGLSMAELSAPIAAISPLAKMRVRLGRALALDPRIVLAEHPNAALSADDTPVFAADFSRIISHRRVAALVFTADRAFAGSVSDQVLTLQPATGELRPAGGWRRWFS